MKNTGTLIIFLSIFTSLLFSCDRIAVVDEYHHIDNSVWTWDDVQNFSFEIQDTVSRHNILIQLRHTTDYPMSNLYVFVNLTGPSGQSIRDTIHYLLAEPDGKWIGKGTGKLRELHFLYRKNTVFPEAGIYMLSLEQGMRESRLPVSDIGIRIEKSVE